MAAPAPPPAGDGRPATADQHDGDLSGTDLSDADLPGADVSDAELSDADLPGADPLRGELEALWRLGPDAVRRRWRAQVGRPMPKGLGRGLTLRILAYHDQVQRHGGLDKASQRVLAASVGPKGGAGSRGGEKEGAGAVALASAAAAAQGDYAGQGAVQSPADRVSPHTRTPDLLRPGTLLQREHGGVLHRVMVLADGFGWNGRSFDSLSQVALAITGTRWNGPRFFGLRDKPEKGKDGCRPVARSALGRSTAPAEAARSVGR